MKQAMLFNLAGTLLIAFSIILHIICLATPNYSEANLNDFAQKVLDYVKKQGLDQSSRDDFNDESMDSALATMHGGINFGMWKLCMSGQVKEEGGSTISMCLTWGSGTSFDPSTGQAKTLSAGNWIRGVQAMAIIGVLLGVAAGIMAIVNLVTPSKGDRLRLIHIFICVACVASGIFILIGDVIMAVNYREIFDYLMVQSIAEVPESEALVELFKDQFDLSWGFALDIVAVALAFLSGVAHILGGRVAQSENSLV